MYKNSRIDVRAIVVRASLALIVTAVGPGLGGCGKQMGRIEENQLKLQAMVEFNTEQIGAFEKRSDQGQQELANALENIRSDTQKLAVDLGAIAGEHAKLQNIVQANARQTTDKIGVMERKQASLQAGIENVRGGTSRLATDIAGLKDWGVLVEEMIENNSQTLAGKVGAIEQNRAELRTEIRSVQAATERVAVELASVAEAQGKLELMVEEDRRETSGKVAAVEQSQLARQAQIDGVKEDVRKAGAAIEALGENLVKLQELLRDDTNNLADIIEVIGQGQIDFEDAIQKDVRGLMESMKLVEQNQKRLDQLKGGAPVTGSAKSAKAAETVKPRVEVSEAKEQD